MITIQNASFTLQRLAIIALICIGGAVVMTGVAYSVREVTLFLVDVMQETASDGMCTHYQLGC